MYGLNMRHNTNVWAGHEAQHENGVGFLLSQKARRSFMGYNPVSPRVIAARFSAKPLNITVIQVYTPTAMSSNEDIDDFYGELEEVLNDSPKKDIKVIMGDWNAKIGRDRDGWGTVMGRFGYGERNGRGERLLDFAVQHYMYSCNTKFQQKPCRKWTWVSPNGDVKNMIDLILIDKRWISSVQQCRSFQGADIESDHSLVMANMILKLKRQVNRPYVKKYDLQQLQNEDMKADFAIKVKQFLNSKEEVGAEQLAEVLNAAVTEVIPEVEKINKKWISAETLELVKEKRLLRLRRGDSIQAMSKYKAKCNEVRKSAREDKRKWIEHICEDIERYHGEYGAREVHKMVRNINRKWQPR